MDLALALPSYARNRRECKPQFVLFDSWDPAQRKTQDTTWLDVKQQNCDNAI